MKKGDKVTLKTGEQLEVLNTKQSLERKKKGKVIAPSETLFLAKSGEHNVWFSESHLKENK